jgi:hypothetical protein
MGRKTKYKKEMCCKVKEFAEKGFINTQLAKALKIDRATFYRWQEKYSDFCDAVKEGKEIVDDLVESALLKRAIGFEYKEVKKITVPVEDEDGEGVSKKSKKTKVIKTETVTKIVPPDVSADMNWLKNRRPDDWRDKQDINLNGNLEIEVEFFDDEDE